MTAHEWEPCEHALTMLEAIAEKPNDLQLRAFACACCRQFLHLLPNESRDALAVAEAFVEGTATERELNAAHASAEAGRKRVRQGTSFKKRKIHPQERAARVVLAVTSKDAWGAAKEAVLASVDLFAKQQTDLLREFLGNPL